MTERNKRMKSESYQRALRLARTERNLMAELIARRQESGLSQNDIAQKLGVSREAIADFESFDSSPTLSSIMSYAHALEVEINFSIK